MTDPSDAGRPDRDTTPSELEPCSASPQPVHNTWDFRVVPVINQWSDVVLVTFAAFPTPGQIRQIGSGQGVLLIGPSYNWSTRYAVYSWPYTAIWDGGDPTRDAFTITSDLEWQHRTYSDDQEWAVILSLCRLGGSEQPGSQ